MRRLAGACTALLFALGILACGGEEGGQPRQQRGGQQAEGPAAQQQQQVEVSDQELEAFVEASIKLQTAAESAKADLKEAGGQDAAQQVRKEFLQTKAEIVRGVGLDTARYSEISQAVRSNPELRSRYMKARRQQEQ